MSASRLGRFGSRGITAKKEKSKEKHAQFWKRSWLQAIHLLKELRTVPLHTQQDSKVWERYLRRKYYKYYLEYNKTIHRASVSTSHRSNSWQKGTYLHTATQSQSNCWSIWGPDSTKPRVAKFQKFSLTGTARCCCSFPAANSKPHHPSTPN
jgi:hypothetical protein